MDLNSAINISKNGYDRQSVESRRIAADTIPSYSGMGLEEQISQFDKMAYGEYTFNNPSQQYDPRLYDAKEDMKRMTQEMSNGLLSKCKLPETIKRSMVENPIIITPEDDKLDEFAERVSNANIDKSVKIMRDLEKIDAREKTLVTEEKNTHSSLDYTQIRSIIEEVFDEKINALSKSINEAQIRDKGHNMTVMKLGENFLMLDDNDDIYECHMVYKGKNKKRKKQ